MDAQFQTTSWSIITKARGSDSGAARDALEALCGQYWRPLYTYVRLKGYTPHDAEDLIQEFFSRLLARDFLSKVDRDSGRFRAFMLACVNNFLSNEWDRRTAAKRGGITYPVALDIDEIERTLQIQGASPQDPVVAFDRQWAETLIAAAEHRLEREYRNSGKASLFCEIRHTLGSTHEGPDYVETARKLEMEEGAVRVAVHRLRKRFAKLVRDEIARTVESESEVQAELEYLFKVLSA